MFPRNELGRFLTLPVSVRALIFFIFSLTSPSLRGIKKSTVKRAGLGQASPALFF